MPELGDEGDVFDTESGVEVDGAVGGDIEAEASAEPEAEAEAEAEPVADEELLAAVPLALSALAEITPEATIGEPLGYIVEGPHVLSLLFATRLSGYPGWRWTVTLARTDDAEPTVVEAELMPGEGALLAPDWVPWSERLADYQAAQQALAAQGAGLEDDESDEDENDDESDDGSDEDESDDEDDDAFDEDDDDEDDRDVHDLHGDDDLDGVDIDSVDVGFDEDTDVDSGLDLEAEEAAALADPADDSTDDDDDDDDDDTEDDDADLASAAPAADREVAEPEDSEDEADHDGPHPGDGPETRGEHDDEGDQPQA